MGRIWRWFKTFNLFQEYLRAAGQHWQEVIGGALLPFLIWGVWFIVGNPPVWINWSAVLLALLIAGYYVWRADHLRLMPKLELVSLHTVSTPTNVWGVDRKFGQILVKCGTEGSLEDCKGQLLRVHKWSAHKNAWEPTHLDEVLDLLWSNADVPSITVEPGADRRLDIFFAQSNGWQLTPFAEKIPFRMPINCAPKDVFKFDIRVSAKDCPPEYASVKVTVGDEWDALLLEAIEN